MKTKKSKTESRKELEAEAAEVGNRFNSSNTSKEIGIGSEIVLDP